MTLIQIPRKTAKVVMAGVFSLLIAIHSCQADLNEEAFKSYKPGDLLNQRDWKVQGVVVEGGGYSDVSDRVEIRRNNDTNNQSIVWRAGFGGEQQTRLLKQFPRTNGTKVIATLDFTPGGADLGGQLIFGEADTIAVALRFKKGSLRVAGVDDASSIDTHASFDRLSSNHLELRFDFESHKLQISMGGQDIGAFSLNPKLTHLDQIVFFAGGSSFESEMTDLSIRTVGEFAR